MWSTSFCAKEAKQVEQTFSRPGNIENITVCPRYGCDDWPIAKLSQISWALLHSSPQSKELTRGLPELIQNFRL
jgi:hypothetical protein